MKNYLFDLFGYSPKMQALMLLGAAAGFAIQLARETEELTEDEAEVFQEIREAVFEAQGAREAIRLEVRKNLGGSDVRLRPPMNEPAARPPLENPLRRGSAREGSRGH